MAFVRDTCLPKAEGPGSYGLAALLPARSGLRRPRAGSGAVAAGTDSGCGERQGRVCMEWGRGTGQ